MCLPTLFALRVRHICAGSFYMACYNTGTLLFLPPFFSESHPSRLQERARLFTTSPKRPTRPMGTRIGPSGPPGELAFVFPDSTVLDPCP
jgi:hypothetical protein